jgi:hypothetical protein
MAPGTHSVRGGQCRGDAGIELYLTEVKGPVMDRLAGTEFLEQLGQRASPLRSNGRKKPNQAIERLI